MKKLAIGHWSPSFSRVLLIWYYES